MPGVLPAIEGHRVAPDPAGGDSVVEGIRGAEKRIVHAGAGGIPSGVARCRRGSGTARLICSQALGLRFLCRFRYL